MYQRSSGTDIVRDFLETDVYNCTHIDAVLGLYPKTWAWFILVDRNKEVFKKGFAGLIKEKFQDLRNLKSDPALRAFLKIKWGHLSDEFFAWVARYKFVPDYIDIWQDSEGHLDGKIVGPLEDTIPMEQIVMAVISQTRNEEENFLPDDNWVDKLIEMIYNLRDGNVMTSEFGFRRRAYNWMHDIVTEKLIKHGGLFTEGGIYVGSSCPYHAQISDTAPKGTVGHFWFLLHAAKYGIENANYTAMIALRAMYGSNLGTIGLTDTFGTDFFFATLTPGMARLVRSYRHDSYDPYLWTRKVLAFNTHPSINIDPGKILNIYTDSLDDVSARKIDAYAKQWFQSAVGIGGAFTNNIKFFSKTPKYRPLNMVIKPYAFSFNFQETWVRVAKTSDSPGKYVGDPGVINDILRVTSKYKFPFKIPNF